MSRIIRGIEVLEENKYYVKLRFECFEIDFIRRGERIVEVGRRDCREFRGRGNPNLNVPKAVYKLLLKIAREVFEQQEQLRAFLDHECCQVCGYTDPQTEAAKCPNCETLTKAGA